MMRKFSTLSETVELMNSESYKNRFIGEYHQTKIRYEKLKDFCNRIEAARVSCMEEPKHDCSLELLREQQRIMERYLHIMEIRAIIEEIEL